MADLTKNLTEMIANEAKELAQAPVIQPIIGKAARCHLCGRIMQADTLQRFDLHVPRGVERWACTDCHPNRAK